MTNIVNFVDLNIMYCGLYITVCGYQFHKIILFIFKNAIIHTYTDTVLSITTLDELRKFVNLQVRCSLLETAVNNALYTWNRLCSIINVTRRDQRGRLCINNKIITFFVCVFFRRQGHTSFQYIIKNYWIILLRWCHYYTTRKGSEMNCNIIRYLR